MSNLMLNQFSNTPLACQSRSKHCKFKCQIFSLNSLWYQHLPGNFNCIVSEKNPYSEEKCFPIKHFRPAGVIGWIAAQFSNQLLLVLQCLHEGCLEDECGVITFTQGTPLLVEKAGVTTDMTLRFTTHKVGMQARKPLWL